ncbi:hypothetical protein E2R51_04420 [Jeotgalibacillus sp. S-D1]|uniref:hypothetical protein n=1 Tax=Jeotgalibacillus sp. S-D1 TaxID=2552189 RepID=UPI00105A62B4|nr:hypothetical protein [Jeotgalibacillus sp. S-D1]TDL34972.1 hypothetical protein E2R51_04420 [Jeotgalibacillus sp. S-D1]
MEKMPESKVGYLPVIEVDGTKYPVELDEYRDYYVLSVKVDTSKTVAVPGFNIKEMQIKLVHNIRYYLEHNK